MKHGLMVRLALMIDCAGIWGFTQSGWIRGSDARGPNHATEEITTLRFSFGRCFILLWLFATILTHENNVQAVAWVTNGTRGPVRTTRARST